MKAAKKAYVNGNIITMESNQPRANAMVTAGNRIVYIGSDSGVAEYIRPETEVFDLKNQTVLPGLIDNHVHFLTTCINMKIVDLKECRSLTEILEKLSDRIGFAKAGEWIQGYGFDHATFQDNPVLPTRWDLDKVSTEHPIVIKRICMHTMVVNSKALALAGIQAHELTNTKEGIAGNGEPNGILCDQDIDLLRQHIPAVFETDAQKKKALAEGMQMAVGFGLTSIRPCHAESLNLLDPIRLYYELDCENSLPVRVCIDSDLLVPPKNHAPFESSKVKAGSYKLFMDGAMGARTAALSEPYSDQPDCVGVLNYTQQECNDLVLKACHLELQPAIHAIGDKGIDMAVSAIEYAVSKTESNLDRRFRLMHGSLMRKDLIERLKKLPVIIDVQPSLLRQSIVWDRARLGKERRRWLYPFKTLIKEGLCLAGGSDSPGESLDPFLGIAYAVTRQNPDGQPALGSNPAERLSVQEALELYTINAAYSSFSEHEKGSLKPGKLADFVIIDRDIFSIPPEKIGKIKVSVTVCDGDFVYSNMNL